MKKVKDIQEVEKYLTSRRDFLNRLLVTCKDRQLEVLTAQEVSNYLCWKSQIQAFDLILNFIQGRVKL